MRNRYWFHIFHIYLNKKQATQDSRGNEQETDEEQLKRSMERGRGGVTVRAQLDLILLSLISPVNVIKMCEHSIFMSFLCFHFECP